MRILAVIVLTFLYCCYATNGEASNQVEVRVSDDSFDEGEIWVGVLRADDSSSGNRASWIRESARDFYVDVPAGGEDSILVFIKKNYPPVTVSITQELIMDGFELEFSSGISIFGSVSTTSDQRITEGSVSLDRIHDFELVPPDPALLSWEIAEDGTYEIHGLQPELKYVLTVSAPEFMPALEEMMLSVDETRREVNFQLARATYVTGRIVDRYESVVRGEFKTVVTPIESQTTEIQAKFDLDDNFRIGPFAEGVTVELTAHDDLDRRTIVVEVQTPAADVQMLMLRWVMITGELQNQDTDEPVEEFQISSPLAIGGGSRIDVSDPAGQFEVEIDEMFGGVVITASGFVDWESSGYINLEERDSYDLGVVELKPAHTVRGRIVDSVTRLPIADAELRRSVRHEGNRSYWVFNTIKTRTNADGEFELSGFSLDGDKLLVFKFGYQNTSVLLDDVKSDLEIELEPQNGKISGRVVSEDGSPIHPAMVNIGAYGKRNDEDGSFTLINLRGKIRLRAGADSGSSDVMEVTVENGQHITDVKLVINESERGRVHGTVTGLLDVEDARISVYNRWRTVKSDGTYEVIGIPMGEHEVVCRASTGQQLSQTIEMDDTLEIRIDFVFEGKSSISGRIMLAGDPAVGMEVQATPKNARHAQSLTTTLGDGTYIMEGLNEGDYDVLVPSRGVSRQVTVSGETNVDIDLGSNELSGHVQASSGSVRGAHVYLTGFGSGGRFQLHTTVDDSGVYRFKGLAAGHYTVIVDHDKIKRETRKVEIENSVQDFDFFVQPTKVDQETSKRSEQLDF